LQLSAVEKLQLTTSPSFFFKTTMGPWRRRCCCCVHAR